MTTNIYTGIEVPYEVQLIHDTNANTTYMTPLPDQQSEGANNPWEHKLEPGVYMATLTYNGTDSATLHQMGGQDAITDVAVPQSDAPRTRSSSPIKISVNSENEYLTVTSNGTGDYRATISIIPTPTYNEFDTSTGATTVDERFTQLETQLSNKADLTTLDSRVPETLALRRDTTVGTRIMAGSTMIYGSTGIRSITNLIPDNDDRGVARIARTGNLVSLTLVNVPTPGSGSYVSLDGIIPEGFRSSFNWQYLSVGKASGIDASGPVRVGTNSSLIVYRSSSETRINASVVYVSDTPWPSTLPGTPA